MLVFVYLIFVVVFFGIGMVLGVVVFVIFVMFLIVCMINLGIC